MRTLKKSLALVLALVMVLGLAVVGASADNAIDKFEDSDQIGDAYLEAVGVLTGLAIVDGMTDTEIAPQGTYQRDQAAKIIAYMVLGKEAADSLVASYAPFQDVPADYWAAGYIAFCKEQGIIDGVSDTSFDPYGTLTGFQWAKMLLAAVGFNANNELEGDSWSLNTARTGHEVGLFDGDIAGADHVALRREQAMLYAFNTLTNVRQVTYTGNGNNYVYDIFGYEWADGTGYTLGYDVFDLKFVEGQIVDNEGMGNSKTVVANTGYKGYVEFPWLDEASYVSVKADTGYDLMWHAVRVWYTGSDTNGTNVYVNDLAKVTTYDCLHMGKELSDDVKDLKKDYSVLENTIGEAGQNYEVYVIDNTALDLESLKQSESYVLDSDYAVITLKADYADMGYAGKTETTLNSNIYNKTYTLDNDDIKTDTSKIVWGDGVIYVSTKSTRTNGVAEYVTAVTTTEGVVTDIEKNTDGVVTLTLSGGTKLELSAFWDDSQDYEDYYALRQNYMFVLDTHGDVIYATKDGARDLYYFTGDVRDANDHGSWNSKDEYRFVNVSTGDEYIVPVSNYNVLVEGCYYDIRVTANDNGSYVATRVFAGQNPYANEYVIDTFSVNSDSKSVYVAEGNVTGDRVYFNIDEITFIVTKGSGDNMTVKTYKGIDALAKDYPNAKNAVYYFANACFTVSGTMTGHKYASTVFVHEDNFMVEGSYVFIPKDVTADNWRGVTSGNDNTYIIRYDGAYVDGVEQPVSIYVDVEDVTGNINDYVLERGFYKWTYNKDANGRYIIEADSRIDDGRYCAYDDVTYIATGINDNVWQFGNSSISGYVDAVAGEVKIVDTTNECPYDEPTLAWLYTYAKTHSNIRLAYTVDRSSGDVDVIYVVDDTWHNVLTIAPANGEMAGFWTVNDAVRHDVADNSNVNVTIVPGSADGRNAGDLIAFDYTLTVDGVKTTGRVIGEFDGTAYNLTIEDVTIGWDQKATLVFDEAFAAAEVVVTTNYPDFVNASAEPTVYVFDGTEEDIVVTLTPTGDASGWTGSESISATVNTTSATITTNLESVDGTTHPLTVTVDMDGIAAANTVAVYVNW